MKLTNLDGRFGFNFFHINDNISTTEIIIAVTTVTPINCDIEPDTIYETPKSIILINRMYFILSIIFIDPYALVVIHKHKSTVFDEEYSYTCLFFYTDSMHRRAFLSGVGALGTFSISGCTQATVKQPTFHIYRTESVDEKSIMACKKILNGLFKDCLQTAGLSFNYTVKVHNESLSVSGTSSAEKFDNFKSQIQGNYLGQHIHIGLDGEVDTAPLGKGEVPSFPTEANRYATIHAGDELRDVDISSLSTDTKKSPLEKPIRSVQILFHEIGHTLGFKHKHGTAWEQNNDKNVHSLMANRDLLYSGTNHFNERLPEPDEEELALQSLLFNPNLNSDYVKL